MEPRHDPKYRRRMEVLLDLCDTSVRIMRQNLRRRDPSATDEQVEERLDAWLRIHPGAELGDAEGVLVNRFADLR